ncbi:hypothetical protein [Nonomuraea longicatena]|uniref:Uncharacterized protein n=1 Tax=Nonomuraea longicatena TaxID=83682 RepID=A0ABP3ZIM1_9ACTN
MRGLLSVRAALLAAAMASPLLAVPAVPAASASSAAPVPLLPGDPFAGLPSLTFQQSFALREAEARALANPAVFAQPYVDVAGTLHAPVTSADAMGAAATPIEVPPESAAPDEGTDDLSLVPPPLTGTQKGGSPAAEPVADPYALPKDPTQARTVTGTGTREFIPRTRVVRETWSSLQAIADQIADLTPAEVPGADKILTTTVDPRNERVVVEATAVTDALRTGLGARFGVQNVAIVHITDPGPLLTVEEDAAPAGPVAPQGTGDRQGDWDPFYGGALIRTNHQGPDRRCTTGFAWRESGMHYMLTAGHCTSMNYFGWSGAGQPVGQVKHDVFDNGTGSLRVNGHFRGDVSLIKIFDGSSSWSRVYVGNKNSDKYRQTAGKLPRRAQHGDKFCTGGAFSGELCGWKVNGLRITLEYNGGKRKMKYAARGTKEGKCSMKGDSGAPVYSVNNQGKIVPRGVLHGGSGGGSDGIGGDNDPCIVYFTDIDDAHIGLPGTLAVG